MKPPPVWLVVQGPLLLYLMATKRHWWAVAVAVTIGINLGVLLCDWAGRMAAARKARRPR